MRIQDSWCGLTRRIQDVLRIRIWMLCGLTMMSIRGPGVLIRMPEFEIINNCDGPIEHILTYSHSLNQDCVVDSGKVKSDH